jgi:hypothetical protein
VDLILTDEEYEKVELFKKEEAIHLALLSKHSMPKTQQISTTFRIGAKSSLPFLGCRPY